MAKSIQERVSERFAEKKTFGQGRSLANHNRSLFLAQKKEIEEALESGWSLKAIWQTLYEEGTISFKYTSFCNYAKKLIIHPPEKEEEKPVQKTSVITKKKQFKAPEQPKQFHHPAIPPEDELF